MVTFGSLNTLPGLDAPPGEFPPPPALTRLQLLPFGDITWENFERLCYRLVKQSATVEHCARYGLQGEAQAGIDVFGRLHDGKYECWQAKRTRTFGAAKLKAAATLFEKGEWAPKSKKFVIAVQASLEATAVQKEIERQVARFKAIGIEFQACGPEQLTEMLRAHPTIIDDFFGRAWVEAILGADVANALTRLDGLEFAKLRHQLGKFYASHFHMIDPGSFGSVADNVARAPLTLLERFVQPDLIVRDGHSDAPENPSVEALDLGQRSVTTRVNPVTGQVDASSTSLRPKQERRRSSISEWTGSGDSFAVLGEAGLGKSTLLRVVALDLLGDQRLFPRLAERWGEYLPLHISFAAWAREVAGSNGPVGLKAIVHRSLQSYLTADIDRLLDQAIDERRVLLLVDGLDEWSDEQAARTALTALVTTAETHAIPAIVTGRPRGLARIGTLPATWKRAEIATLSRSQQLALARTWFDRYSPAEEVVSGRTVVRDRADTFLGEISRDRGLATLASTPLLLVGLVTLRLRGKILPRNRIEAFQQLVDLLLEQHPAQRATAAGDAQSRFRHADDGILRRSAIARLAFAVRELGGGAGFPIAEAKRVLVAYLSNEDGFDLDPAKAKAAVNEILSVNAETQGMLVEKAPGEIGFAHASFEEFLSAEHLQGMPFARVLEFVEGQAGEPRWRNVIANLMAIITRRDEFDQLVAAIERPSDDMLVSAYKNGVLAEVGFGSSARFPSAAKRLAGKALAEIEFGEWMPLRRDGLDAALRAVDDPVVGPMVTARLPRWTPMRQDFRGSLIEVLAARAKRDDIADTLWLAMHDDERGTQKAAALAYAKWFEGNPERCDQLLSALRRTARPHIAAAYLECLIHGWPDLPELDAILIQARRSFNPTLRLLALAELTKRGDRNPESKDELLNLQSFWGGVDYADKSVATRCLFTGWKDDADLIDSAIVRVTGGGPTRWEYDAAQAYLLNCSTDNATIQSWLLRELTDKEFLSTIGVSNVWMAVGRFAQANADIREAGIQRWLNEKSRFLLRELQEFVPFVPDERLKALAMDVMQGDKNIDQHWACLALLSGWGPADPDVQNLFDEVKKWPAERLKNLSALLPDIEPDRTACRRLLLSVSKISSARRDLIATGLERCGCDSSDDEAVAAILSDQAGTFGGRPYGALFGTFQQHPDVRKLAQDLIDDAEAPLAALAQMADQNEAIREAVLAAAVPLPFELRSDIADTAIASGPDTLLGDRLAQYDSEADGNLKVRQAIGYYRWLHTSGDRDEAVPRLEKEIIVYGPDLESKRAAALAGFTILGELPRLAVLEERGKPVNLSMGSYTFPISAMSRLMCEHWGDLRTAFGDDLQARFKSLGSVSISKVLGEGAYLSEAAATEFLHLVESDPRGLPPTALRSLAILRPASPLLRERCLASLGNGQHGNEQTKFDADIAQILADALPDDADVLKALTERIKPWPSATSVLTLGIYSPGHAMLEPLLSSAAELTREFGGWAAAAQIVGPFANTDGFVRFVTDLITRGGFYSRFDVQPYANRAIEARLRRDDEAVERMTEEIGMGAHPSVLATFPRLLAAAGKMDDSLRDRVTALMNVDAKEQLLPLAGYDVIAEGIRSVRLSMFDALQFGAEI